MPNTKNNKSIPTEQENPLFHNTWKQHIFAIANCIYFTF